MCGQQLLFDTTNWQNFATQCDLAGHRDIAADGDAGQRADQRCCHGHSRRRSILRNRTLRYVNVEIDMTMEISLDPVLIRSRPNIAHGGLSRFLHHFAEFSCQSQLALAGH